MFRLPTVGIDEHFRMLRDFQGFEEVLLQETSRPRLLVI